MIKRFFFITLVLLLVFGSLIGFNMYMQRKVMDIIQKTPPPPITVTTIIAQEEEISNTLSTIGTLKSYQSIPIYTEFGGIVTKIYKDSGSTVKQGEILVKLDTSLEEAELKALNAQLNFIELELKRANELIKTKSISQSEYDSLISKKEEILARIEAQKIKIEKKSIKAPFSGILSIKEFDFGQLVQPNTLLYYLHDISKLYIEFSLPQNHFKDILLEQEIQFTVDTYPGEIFHAKIKIIEKNVDESTRNFKIRALILNENFKLLPGMYVNVNIITNQKKKYITVPITSILYAPYGNSVFIIREDGKDTNGNPIYKTQRRTVKTGEKIGDKIVILSGLNPGEQVITSGVFKLKGEEVVKIDNSIKIDFNERPNLPNT